MAVLLMSITVATGQVAYLAIHSGLKPLLIKGIE